MTSPVQDKSLGELVASATADVSTLLRKEVALAKLEIGNEVKNAGKGVGAFGAAGLGWARSPGCSCPSPSPSSSAGCTATTSGWGSSPWRCSTCCSPAWRRCSARRASRKVGPPERTISTVKDDIAFAKHPTTAPTRASTPQV